MNITKNSSGEIQPGDLVFSVPHGENGCLVGKVTAIMPLGSPEHESGNKTDDIHVDFFAPYSVRYSDNRTAEIAQEYSALYGKPLTYDELPLDDVIMSPDSLVRINGIDSWDRDTLLASREKAEAYYNSHLSEDCAMLHAELIERLNKNFADYRSYLMGFSKDEIIDMADKIHAMSDAHTYMTSWHDFDIDELRFFLQFQKPLEVLADVWCDRNSDLCDMGYSMDHIKERSSEFLEKCPLLSDMPAPIKQEKKDALVDYPLMGDFETTSETPPIEFVGREAKQAYNMGAAEFEKLMYGLLPDASLTAMMNWKGYASGLEANGTHTKAEFFLEMFIEFDLVKQHYGEKIAMKLFDYAEHFTLNPFEVRGAANHLWDGKHISEIENLYVKGELDRTSQELNESEQATRAFIANEGKYKRLEKTDHEQVTQSTPEKPPAVPQKRSLGDKLQAAGEKVKAQNTQDNKNKSRKREERE